MYNIFYVYICVCIYIYIVCRSLEGFAQTVRNLCRIQVVSPDSLSGFLYHTLDHNQYQSAVFQWNHGIANVRAMNCWNQGSLNCMPPESHPHWQLCTILMQSHVMLIDFAIAFLKIYFILIMYMSAHLCMSAGVLGDSKRTSAPLELEFQAVGTTWCKFWGLHSGPLP